MASLTQAFGDFVATTGPAYMTSAGMIVNEAGKNNYILRRFTKGQDSSEVLQGGQTIKDTIMFDEQNSLQYVDPNQSFTWDLPQVLTDHTVYWRFGIDRMSWTDQEIQLNTGGGLSRAQRFHQFKRLKYSKEQRMWTSVFNGIEDQLWAVPETANMEAETGREPYSIPAFINEQLNGLFYNDATPSGKTAWTTKAALSPTTYSKWVPQQETYDSASSNNSGNIFAAFDRIFLDVNFDSPPTMEEYFSNTNLFSQFIACSHRGLSEYQHLLRAQNDTLVTVSRQDPSYMRPMYAGISLEKSKTLGDAKLYYDGASGGTTYDDEIPTDQTSTGVDSGPRYYFVNAQYLKIVWHEERYFYKHPVLTHPNQPHTHTMPVDCWYNLFPRSLQRQGIVSPSGTVYS